MDELSSKLEISFEKLIKPVDEHLKKMFNYFEENIYENIETLFHYTSEKNAFSILESREFYASNIMHVNDPSEVYFGINHIFDFFEEVIDSSRIDNERKEIIGLHIKRCRNICFENAHKLGASFIASFCTSGDNLPQWQTYADNGNGVALEFDRKELEDFIRLQRSNNFHSFKIVYAPFDKPASDEYVFWRCELRKFWEMIIDLLLKYHNQDDERNLILSHMMLNVIVISHTIKHGCYLHENEYRFLFVYKIIGEKIESDAASFQKNEGRDLIKFTWTDQHLKSLKIGPSFSHDGELKLMPFELRELLQSKGFDVDSIEIKQSKLPYRGKKFTA